MQRPLCRRLEPLLGRHVKRATVWLNDRFPVERLHDDAAPIDWATASAGCADAAADAPLADALPVWPTQLLLRGGGAVERRNVAEAVLATLRPLRVIDVGPQAVVSSTSLTPRQQLLATIAAAVRVAPAVVYVPRVDEWVCGSLHAWKGFLSGALCTIPAGTPIVLLATTERHWREGQPAWPSATTNHIHNGAAVTVEQRKTYFAPLHAELSCALREVHRRAVADAAADTHSVVDVDASATAAAAASAVQRDDDAVDTPIVVDVDATAAAAAAVAATASAVNRDEAVERLARMPTVVNRALSAAFHLSVAALEETYAALHTVLVYCHCRSAARPQTVLRKLKDAMAAAFDRPRPPDGDDGGDVRGAPGRPGSADGTAARAAAEDPPTTGGGARARNGLDADDADENGRRGCGTDSTPAAVAAAAHSSGTVPAADEALPSTPVEAAAPTTAAVVSAAADVPQTSAEEPRTPTCNPRTPTHESWSPPRTPRTPTAAPPEPSEPPRAPSTAGAPQTPTDAPPATPTATRPCAP